MDRNEERSKEEKKLNSLTWKYFWQQKVKEISFGVLLIILATIFPFLLGSLVNNLFNLELKHFAVWMVGFYFSILVVGVVCLVIVVVCSVIVWIKSNWKKAKSRAEEELELK